MSGVEKVLLNNIGITHLYIALSFIDPTKGISLKKGVLHSIVLQTCTF